MPSTSTAGSPTGLNTSGGRRIAVATSVYAALGIMLGGGTRAGFLSDVVLQLLAVPLVLWLMARLLDVTANPDSGRRRATLVLVAVVAIFGFHIAQLLPLPPSIWQHFPQRADTLPDLMAAGVQPLWLPISVSSTATWISMVSLLPASAILLATLQLDYRARHKVSLVLLAMTSMSIVVGLLQIAQGPSSPLYFFETTNRHVPVGFFANRNHYAALLYCMLLLAAAWAVVTAAAYSRRMAPTRSVIATNSAVTTIACFTLLVLLLGSQTLTRSRAGLGLSMLALGITVAMIYLAPLGSTVSASSRRERRSALSRRASRLILSAAALAIFFSTQLALYRILDRFEADPLADVRGTFAQNTIAAAKAYMPFGSGMGTFVSVYEAFEKPSDGTGRMLVNRAHNDLLELWLEAGGFGLVAIGVAILLLGFATIRIWRRGMPGGSHADNLLACAAAAALWLLFLHSWVDYPLRTAAMMMLAAFFIGLLVPPVGIGVRPAAEPVASNRRRSHRPAVEPRPAVGWPAEPAYAGRVTTESHEALTDTWPQAASTAAPLASSRSGEPPVAHSAGSSGGETQAPSPPRKGRYIPPPQRDDWPEAWRKVPNSEDSESNGPKNN